MCPILWGARDKTAHGAGKTFKARRGSLHTSPVALKIGRPTGTPLPSASGLMSIEHWRRLPGLASDAFNDAVAAGRSLGLEVALNLVAELFGE